MRTSLSKTFIVTLVAAIALAAVPLSYASSHDALIPVLGTTMEKTPVGRVVYLELDFEARSDDGGLAVLFKSLPGRISPGTQTAVGEAIYHAARAMGVSPLSWTVMITLPYPGVTLYGESCSAMIALSVLAMAQGEGIPGDRVITGTVTPDGRIGPVSALPLTLTAAHEAHLRRVLIPEEQDRSDDDYEIPFLMQVSPVGSVAHAYQAFIELPFIP
jgi:predicted S18 family serine protease